MTRKSSEAGLKIGAPASSGATLDSWFEGELQLRQSRGGYRFSLDAVLLAHYALTGPCARVADLGAGNGVIAVILAYLRPSLKITAIEIQASLAEHARNNFRINRLDQRIEIVSGDIREIASLAPRESYDLVVCNPPFRKSSSGRLSPHEERKIARHEVYGTIRDFLHAGRYLLATKGRMALVYPAVRCVELLDSMRQAGIEPKRLRMVHSYRDAEASLILVDGVKGGRSGVQIIAPLVIYENAKRYSDEVARMLRGNTD
jgi:tRNA1Val (adenine37-N6)-methyltransferase